MVRTSHGSRFSWQGLPSGPGRLLVFGSFVNSVGTGLWMPANILYFSQEVGIPTAQLALGMSTAGIIGLFGSSVIGRVIRRYGARRTLIAFSVLQTAVVISYSFVTTFALYLPLVILAIFAGRSGQVCRNVLAAAAASGEETARLQAFTRSANNGGFSVGVTFSGLLMHLSALTPFLILIAGNALSYVATALAAARLPRRLDQKFTERTRDGRRSSVLRDLPFIVVTALTLVLCMRDALLFVGLPLWVAQHTAAPRSLVAVLILVNTVMCVLLQVWASRGTGDLHGGARALRRSGYALAAGCLAYWAGAAGGAVTASVLLLCGVVIHTLGEVWQAAGAWGVSYALPPEGRLPDYQAFFSLTNVGRDVLGPVVATAVVGWEGPGWGILALAFSACALASPPAARWAQSTRLARPLESGPADAAGPAEAAPEQAARSRGSREAHTAPPAGHSPLTPDDRAAP
ncbi:MFS transporter [Streptomyces antioxidans]|uniref:MFS transporter n=1 Tax=Streptomyces antioxidans TaxID=1507734 RepID=A0A1V4D1B3_9ACTN|nr:MFS transporter [Streptomyces antioxidans]OPF76711.1 MFS transporter [Streptomyces antioxidans]